MKTLGNAFYLFCLFCVGFIFTSCQNYLNKGISHPAKLTPANNMRVQADKGAFLFWQYIVNLERKQVSPVRFRMSLWVLRVLFGLINGGPVFWDSGLNNHSSPPTTFENLPPQLFPSPPHKMGLRCTPQGGTAREKRRGGLRYAPRGSSLLRRCSGLVRFEK